MTDDLEVPQNLYDSEISFSISVFWDNGFKVAIGIAPDFNEEANVPTFREACIWLRAAAIRHYPDSVFAKKHGGSDGQSTKPLVTTVLNGKITDTQRNGSITGIGIILGFSLNFVHQWASRPDIRMPYAISILNVAVIGVFFQMVALFLALFLLSPVKRTHMITILVFMVGLVWFLAAFGLGIGTPLPPYER